MNYYKYGLHDCIISKVNFENSILSLSFNKGVYYLDNENKELSLSPSCICNLTLPELHFDDIVEYITINKKRKNRVVEISYQKLCKMLENNYMSIDNDYYSFFNNSLLLKGFIGKYQVEIEITDIVKREFVFSQE